MIAGAFRRAVLAHRGWRYRARVDPFEIRWMLGLLEPGDLAVDVGAYKGGYTYWMRRRVGPSGGVLAFEPQPEPAAHLQRCVDAFRWTNVRVEQFGLSSRPGVRVLLRPGPGRGASPSASLQGASLPAEVESRSIDVDTLDRYLRERPTPSAVRLIKLDVEGHELDVLEGAAETIGRDRPFLILECETRHDRTRSVEDVFRRLADAGYEGSFFWHGAETPLRRFEPAVHQVLGRKPYVNNFVFRPR